MAQSNSGFVEVNGARLSYELAGAGQPLVMAHGHLLDSGQWDDQFELFSRQYRVVRYDARGFGQSDKPAAPFAYYQDLYRVMAALGIEHAYLIGCSGGGATIIDFALAYPQMTDALILVGSAISGYQWTSEPPPLLVELRASQERGDLDRAVELSLRLWTDGARRAPEQVDQAARERTRTMTRRLWSRPQVEAEIRTLAPPAIGRLAEISAPTLAIVGSEDIVPILEMADLVAAEVPGARKVLIPDAGHHPNMEHPGEFNQLVLDFFSTIEGNR